MSTTKGSTRMVLVHVQKMYKTCIEDVQYIRILIEVSDYSSSFFFFPKMKRKPSPPEEKIFRDNKRKY